LTIFGEVLTSGARISIPPSAARKKQNINVWTIYAPDAGHRGRGFFLATRAQSNLSELSDATGAESFYLGTGAPVTIKPYLDELAMHLSNQYLLTFNASGGPKGRFTRAKVSTELGYVEFTHASQVFLAAGEVIAEPNSHKSEKARVERSALFLIHVQATIRKTGFSRQSC